MHPLNMRNEPREVEMQFQAIRRELPENGASR
jgi:hypothetical protein